NQGVLASSYIISGKVRALVLAAARGLPILLVVPCSSEAAMPDLQVNAWTALFARRETPEAVVRKLNSAVGQTLAEDGVLKRLSALGVDVPSPEQRTPVALKDLIDSEFNKWLPLLQSAENVRSCDGLWDYSKSAGEYPLQVVTCPEAISAVMR